MLGLLLGNFSKMPVDINSVHRALNELIGLFEIGDKKSSEFLRSLSSILQRQADAIGLIKTEAEKLLESGAGFTGQSLLETVLLGVKGTEMEAEVRRMFSEARLTGEVEMTKLMAKLDTLSLSPTLEKLLKQIETFFANIPGFIPGSEALEKLELQLSSLRRELATELEFKGFDIWKELNLGIDKFTHSLSFQQKFYLNNLDSLKKIEDQQNKIKDIDEKIQSIRDIKPLAKEEAGEQEQIDALKIQRDLELARKETLKEELKIQEQVFLVQQMQSVVMAHFIDIERAIGQAVEDSFDTLFDVLEKTDKPLKALAASFGAFARSLADSIREEITRITAFKITSEFIDVGFTQSLATTFVDGANIWEEALKRGIVNNSIIGAAEFERVFNNFTTQLGLLGPTLPGQEGFIGPINAFNQPGGPLGAPFELVQDFIGPIQGEMQESNSLLDNIATNLPNIFLGVSALRTLGPPVIRALNSIDDVLFEIAKDIGPMAAAFVGAAAGGGGVGARTGATFGALFGSGKWQDKIMSKFFGNLEEGTKGWFGEKGGGMLGNIIGSFLPFGLGALGGWIGGAFDDDEKKMEENTSAVDRNTDVLKRNVEVVENLNRLLSIQNQLINVPAGFTIPSFGGTFGGGPVGGGGPTTVNININGTGQNSQDIANQVRDTLSDFYGSQMTRTASRTSRFGPG